MGTVDSRHNLRGPRGALLGQLDTRLLAGQARVAILQAIFDGRFTEKLPNEERLAEMLNVSRTTVRAALLGLERDGVVTRHRAIGTLINPHVRPSSLALQRLIGFDGLLTERGYEVRVELASEWVLAGEEIARAFDLEPTRECLRLEKEYWADEALALVIIDWIPKDAIVDPEAIDTIDPSLFLFSQEHLVTSIDHAVVKLVPMAKKGDGSRLALEEGAPFLRLHETHYSSRGETLAYSMIDVADEFIQLEVVRTQ